MKSQKAQEAEARKPHTVMLNQPGATTPISTPARHAHITTRAYELYVQRGCREGCAVEDWLDAEGEIVSREFPVSSSSGRGASL